ncbi:AbrB family transcriptional regulator [Paenibacillus thailandensis]|uniref:AbrB family transcriptional regulator n=1 Tax=Paenibacillus thailandensis TaxID=393250 RepID=A0ABW5QU12_9BACL
METIIRSKTARVTLSLLTAVIGGFLFEWLQIPVPWLLGPMIATLIGSSAWKGSYVWPTPIRNASMITIGYTMGLAMTGEALREIGRQLPYMLIMTALLLLYCACIAYAVSKLSKSDFKTALMSSIPGGLSQVLILAEETKGVNITVVTVTQVMRVMMIVVCMPLIVYSPLLGYAETTGYETAVAETSAAATAEAASWGGLFPNVLLFASVCTVFALAGQKIKLPTAFLLGPIIGSSIMQFLGIRGPVLPDAIMNGAQLSIGVYVGLMLKPAQLPNKLRTLTLAAASGMVLIAGAVGFSLLLSRLEPVSFATGLLSLAPGGMDQMGAIAHAIDADLSMVTGYQLFRIFFILFVVPPLWRVLFKTKPSKAVRAGTGK